MLAYRRAVALTFWLSLFVAISARGLSCPADFLPNVDPLIGTEGTGSEYGGMMPMTGVPIGSFQAVAMTRTNAIGRTSFNALDEKLLGVILTRQPAIWMGDWGEVRIPLKEAAKIVSADYRPYYTKVVTEKGAVEFTASEHAAWIRFSEPGADALGGSGFSTNRMDAHLGYPLPNFKGWYYVERPTDRDLRIGLSLISLEQATRNLEAEMPGGDSFEAVVVRTRAKWEEQLGRLKIEAPDEVKRIFYTGLYHCSLYPRRIDEDGRYYSAFDDNVHEGRMYTSFSLWDTYRAEHPLLILLNPERVGDMMQSLLRMYQEGGWLPKWPNPSYTGIMTGAPAEIALAEAMAKGVAGFDYDLAREAIQKNATVPQKFDETRRWEDRGCFGREPETRAGLTSYLKRGYVACDQTAESVSRTLDFSFADRNRNYTNLWNAAARRFLPRKANGEWDASAQGAYTECNADTALWCVPHDVEGLVVLLGGPAAFECELDRYFDEIFFKPNEQGSSFHGNEPTHHTAYLYNRIGKPEKTQRRVRDILTRCYSSNRRGFDGNEDCGAMSAWYVFSALGFYPLDPASGEYEIGSPLVKSAQIGKLRIKVNGYSPERWRVKSVTLNGKPITDWKIRHEDIMKGGELVFEMCNKEDLLEERMVNDRL